MGADFEVTNAAGWNVRIYLFASISSLFTLVFMRSIFVTPWVSSLDINSSVDHCAIVSLTSVPFTVFSVLCSSVVTVISASLLINFS